MDRNYETMVKLAESLLDKRLKIMMRCRNGQIHFFMSFIAGHLQTRESCRIVSCSCKPGHLQNAKFFKKESERMSKGGGGPQPGGGSERETAAIAIRRETDGLRGGSVVRSGGGTGGGRGRASHTDGVGQRANKRQSFLAW
ncbi:unnamed protein product, partial [Nesidiocoris tenuis]